MNHLLTKLNYLSFLQCPKRLWLEKFMPEKAEPVSSSQQYFIEEGERVERLAKGLFGEGVAIDRELSIAERLQQTRNALSNGAAVIFEASFLVGNLFAATDILQKESDAWKLIEIKATNKVSKEYIQDIAFQYFILQRARVPITTVNIMYLNKDASYEGTINKDFFVVKDISREIEPYIGFIDNHVTQANAILAEQQAPQGNLCRTCFQNTGCPFKSYCWQNIKKPTIFDIPLHWKYRDELTDKGMLLLDDIPNDMALKDNVKIIIESGKKQAIDIDKPGIQKWLNQLEFPLYFLDFETYGPAIPLFNGMKPYQRIPFQFSCHVLEKKGQITHKEFLHEEPSDPRLFFVESLMQTVGQSGSIVVYHKSFESSVINELLTILPKLERTILRNYMDRLVDLEEIFK